MSYFINLPLSYAAKNNHYIEYGLKHGLWPEIGIDAWSMQQLPRAWHIDLADQMHQAGLSCSVHLPFFDLRPGSLDNGILEASRKRLQEAVGLAKIYQPLLMVGHPSFDPWQHVDHFDEWLVRSKETWRSILALWPDGPPLYLENVHEKDPLPLLKLLDYMHEKRIGLCLDLGHWFSYAQGCKKDNLRFWVDAVAPYLRHLHLHDNDGSGDQHKGLGQGAIPVKTFLTLLAEKCLCPTFTLEPHSLEDFKHSHDYIEANKSFFKPLFML